VKRNRNNSFFRIISAAALVLALSFCGIGQAIWPLLQKAAMIGGALCMPEAVAAHIADRFEAHSEPPQIAEIEVNSQISEQKPVVFAPKPPEKEDKPSVMAVIPEQSSSSVIEPPPDIPKDEQGEILTEDMRGKAGNNVIPIGNFLLRNDTSLSANEIAEVLKQPMKLALKNTTEPQVLIYHTHATESYCPFDSGIYDKRYNWRSTDNNNNMVAVGAVLAQVLRENGIAVIHDTAQHDYPSYDGSYANSYRSIKDYLAHYPTIKVVLDVHRDAIERENSVIVKPTATINGEKCAQLMIISNCDDGSGLIPNWRENLRFAAAFSNKLEQNAEGITRPLLFSYRKYNQQLSTGALLLEFGSHANTLEESKRTARIVGQALSELLIPQS